jgi:septal ring factor EnvC (AmiA/AmiB activator)
MDGSTPILELECLQDQIIRVSNAISAIENEIAVLHARISDLKKRRDGMESEKRTLVWQLRERAFF